MKAFLSILTVVVSKAVLSVDASVAKQTPQVYYPDTNATMESGVFCGSESQGYVAKYTDDGCSSQAVITVVEHGTFRAGMVPPDFYVLPGRTFGTVRFLKKKRNPQDPDETWGWPGKVGDEYLGARVVYRSVVELEQIDNSGGVVRFQQKGPFGTNFTVNNLSIGSNYSVYIKRCLDIQNVRTLVSYNKKCCQPYDLLLHPLFTGVDAQTPQQRRYTENMSNQISQGLVIFLISSLILYMVCMMGKVEIQKRRRMYTTALGTQVVPGHIIDHSHVDLLSGVQWQQQQQQPQFPQIEELRTQDEMASRGATTASGSHHTPLQRWSERAPTSSSGAATASQSNNSFLSA